MFTALNYVALLGWAVVAVWTSMIYHDPVRPSAELRQLTLICEVISAIDIVRIALGQLRGDLVLGLDVHYTRFMMLFFTLSHEAVSHTVAKLILFAWSITEVARYPMVLFPRVAALRTVRYSVPLITFPLGAGTEAFAAYIVLFATPHAAHHALLKCALGLIILVNFFGVIAWYPSMVAKVQRSLRPASEQGRSSKKGN
jgi:hypothetical protein